MSDNENPPPADDEIQSGDEMTMLKQRARMMGIAFSNNIGLETLRLKIQQKLENSEPEQTDDADVATAEPAAADGELNPLAGDTADSAPNARMSIRQKLKLEQMRLVRLRITCLNPAKKDVPGEIYTLANEYLGTVRKYVPFGEVTEDGYHVPWCIYQMMAEKQFLNLRTRKLPNGQERVEQSWAKEFALEVLPPLTKAELDRLATAQAAAGVFADAA